MSRVLAIVAALALAITLTACEAEGPPASPIDGHPTTLAGTSWIVTAIGGMRTLQPEPPSIAFDGQRVEGSGGCNHFSGTYRYDPTTGELRFDELGMTAMACAEQARNAMETAFMTALGQPGLLAMLQPDGSLVLGRAGGTRLDLVIVGPAVTD